MGWGMQVTSGKDGGVRIGEKSGRPQGRDRKDRARREELRN